MKLYAIRRVRTQEVLKIQFSQNCDECITLVEDENNPFIFVTHIDHVNLLINGAGFKIPIQLPLNSRRNPEFDQTKAESRKNRKELADPFEMFEIGEI